MTAKDVLRRACLARRGDISAGERAGAARAVAERLADLAIGAGEVVAGYWPIRSELDPRPSMARLADRGFGLALPAVTGPHTVEFRRWVRSDELVDTGFGTKGPGPDAPRVDPGLILLPLAAFDRRGGRLGYGAGFYDRLIADMLARGRTPRLCGMAFACQEIDAVPLEPHDQLLHMVATETELISCR